jgi:ketosteroid isomerase-like protein
MAVGLIDRLHNVQNRLYAGEDVDPELRQILTEDVIWIVPGANDIAGQYEGIDQVMDYFARRKRLADNTMRMIRRDVLVGAGGVMASLSDGVRVADGVMASWRTVGLYRVRAGRVSACWLLPLDSESFDRIWTGVA